MLTRWTQSAWWAVALVGVTSGCGPLQQVAPCSPSASGVTKPSVVVLLAGQSADVDLQLPPAVFCQNGNPVAVDVVTEVLDVANTSLAHTHAAPSSSDTKGYGTTITFTPQRAGTYYLSARFEPALGLARRQVQVLEDRGGDVPRRIPASGLCDEVLGVEQHALCRRGAQLSVLDADGGTTRLTSIDGVAAAKGVAWWWNDAGVTRGQAAPDGRWTETTLALDVPLTAPLNASPSVLTFAQADVLEVHALDDGGLGVRHRPIPFTATGPGLSRAGDAVGFATDSSLCAMRDTAVDDAGVRCIERIGFTPGAGQGDVLWLRGVETGVVALARVNELSGNPDVLLVDAQPATFVDLHRPLPAFTWNGHLLSVRAEDLTFEAWTAPPRMQRQFVTAEHVVFQTPTELVVFRR